jgi:uncharacterized membrane protein YsdA (DUF1294 family)/cold shock CspA family protein
MRLQGKITRWDDEKGFGFISWHGDGTSAFVHIKAFPRSSRRPKVGDIVSYEIAKGKNGKSRAEKVRFSDQSQPKHHSTGKRQNGPLPVVFTSSFVCFLFLAAYFDRISWMVVVAYFVASLVTFFAYAWDKSSARLGAWRTTEASLHLMGLVGGWPGALAAQRLFRHKSSKQEFLSVFWITAFLNVAAVGYLTWSGDAGFINQLIDGLWRTVAK